MSCGCIDFSTAPAGRVKRRSEKCIGFIPYKNNDLELVLSVHVTNASMQVNTVSLFNRRSLIFMPIRRCFILYDIVLHGVAFYGIILNRRGAPESLFPYFPGQDKFCP